MVHTRTYLVFLTVLLKGTLNFLKGSLRLAVLNYIVELSQGMNEGRCLTQEDPYCLSQRNLQKK